MLIFGYDLIPSRPWCKVSTQKEVASTSSSTVILLGLNSLDVATYCKEQNVDFALEVESTKEALIASALGASYLLCAQDVAKEIQAIANEYLWIAKVIVPIENEDELEIVARLGIDGVIFAQSIR
ncbi:MAG: hypothetical protein JXQ68_07800 [Campylobacterales bacterium]|nr:hypothetical protein [Campylobacterales bacterium]